MVDVDRMWRKEDRRQADRLTNKVAGTIISINADFVDWPDELREYIDAAVAICVGKVYVCYELATVFLKP